MIHKGGFQISPFFAKKNAKLTLRKCRIKRLRPQLLQQTMGFLLLMEMKIPQPESDKI
ncbi:hypothetical protein D3C76_1822020 [compost metagenome]